MPVVAFALLPGRKDKNGNSIVWDEYDLAGVSLAAQLVVHQESSLHTTMCLAQRMASPLRLLHTVSSASVCKPVLAMMWPDLSMRADRLKEHHWQLPPYTLPKDATCGPAAWQTACLQ